MIYIKCFLNVVSDNFIKVVFIFLLSFGSTYFLSNKKTTLDLIGLSESEIGSRISFVTTLNTNFQDLKNKIIILPGVKKIEQKNGSLLKEKISLLFKSDVFQEVFNQSPGYHKFTIYFKNDVTLKSINLIKSYVIKILSGEEVVFGKIIEKKKNAVVSIDQAYYAIYGFFILVLLSLYGIFDHRLRKVTYLYQRFQRGNGLQYKVSFLSFVLLMLLPTTLTFIYFESFSGEKFLFFLVPTIIFYFILNLKRYSWIDS